MQGLEEAEAIAYEAELWRAERHIEEAYGDGRDEDDEDGKDGKEA